MLLLKLQGGRRMEESGCVVTELGSEGMMELSPAVPVEEG